MWVCEVSQTLVHLALETVRRQSIALSMLNGSDCDPSERVQFCWVLVKTWSPGGPGFGRREISHVLTE